MKLLMCLAGTFVAGAWLYIFQPWPQYGVRIYNHASGVPKTIWVSPDGKECGHAWPEDDGTERWYAFHDHGTEFGHDYVNKDDAYAAIGWWCRP